jgi:undecaprenyl-diphosphatase
MLCRPALALYAAAVAVISPAAAWSATEGPSGLHTMLARDRAAERWISSHHYPVLDWILGPVSFAGEVAALWLLIGVAMIIFGRGRVRMTGAFLVATIALTDRLIAAPLAHFFHRTRPYLAEPGLRQVGIRWAGSSFPSGHGHSVMIALILLGSEYRKALPALGVFALLTLYSRPYLGMHYPLDTLAGAAIGTIAGLAALRLRRWLERRRARSQGQAP